MSHILCIDIGTSRIKAALVDEHGAMPVMKSERINRAASPDTQDALVWRSVTVSLLRSMAQELAQMPPLAVSLTGNMHALLGIGADGQPVADAVLWCSNAAAEEAEKLSALVPDFAKKYGNPPAPVFTLPKMIQCAEKMPELYQKVRYFLQPKDDIGYLLTGTFATDPSDASGMMPFLPDERCWDESMIRELHLDPAKFPPVLESAALRGTVTAQAAALTGLPAGLPVVCGAGDLATAALGCGAAGDVLSLTLGTAGQLLASGPRGRWKPLAGKLFVFAHADPESNLFLGSVPGGGFSLEWEAAQRNMTMDDFFKQAELAELKEDLPVYLPYLLGRGAPYMDYTPCAAWHGLSARHTLPDLCRAAIFGPLAALRQSADLLGQLNGTEYRTVVLQSLACRERSVRETAAALFRQKKRMPENTEASLLGAAVLGAAAVGLYPTIDAAIRGMVHTTDLPERPENEQLAAETLFSRYLEATE